MDVTAGYAGDPQLRKVFETEGRGEPDGRLSQVIEGPIRFFALCEQQTLPFYGYAAYVGYLARKNIIDISRLTQLVRLFAARFTGQERIGQQIADTLETLLQPHGVAVYLEAQPLSTPLRGRREIAPVTRTTAWRGRFAKDAALQAEFFTACGLPK